MGRHRESRKLLPVRLGEAITCGASSSRLQTTHSIARRCFVPRRKLNIHDSIPMSELEDCAVMSLASLAQKPMSELEDDAVMSLASLAQKPMSELEDCAVTCLASLAQKHKTLSDDKVIKAQSQPRCKQAQGNRNNVQVHSSKVSPENWVSTSDIKTVEPPARSRDFQGQKRNTHASSSKSPTESHINCHSSVVSTQLYDYIPGTNRIRTSFDDAIMRLHGAIMALEEQLLLHRAQLLGCVRKKLCFRMCG